MFRYLLYEALKLPDLAQAPAGSLGFRRGWGSYELGVWGFGWQVWGFGGVWGFRALGVGVLGFRRFRSLGFRV